MKKLMLFTVLGFFASIASAGVIYSNNFSSSVDGWRGGSIVDGAFQQKRRGSVIRFNLKDQHIEDVFNISFDALALGNWEQGGKKQDYFFVIDRVKGPQNDERLFFGSLDDGWNSFSFYDVPAFKEDKLRIRFGSKTNRRKELFAIDNVVVWSGSKNPAEVSEPATLALLGLAVIGLVKIRRSTEA